jgi:Fur family ferric uptake transcriptional regulator
MANPRSKPVVSEPKSTPGADREAFTSFLNRKGLRVTDQRMAIYDAALGIPDHFTAEELLEKSRAIDDSVSRATVYRALPIMVESAVIREVDVGRDHKYYIANRDVGGVKIQLVCLDCDKIFESAAPPIMDWYGKALCSKHNMEPATQRLQVTAHCLGCDRKSAAIRAKVK